MNSAVAMSPLKDMNCDNIHLTLREKEILQYLFWGVSAKKIALTLKISNRTVEKHIEHLRMKFNCGKTATIIALCVRHRILRDF